MRSYLSVSLSILLLPALAVASDDRSAEVYGGYTFFKANAGGGINLDGWNASLTGKVNDWVGVVGDFAGYRGRPSSLGFGPEPALDTTVHSFLFGPRVYGPKLGTFRPFVHALFGAARAGTDGVDETFSDTSFAIALGGGLDLPLAGSMAIRLFQADYVTTGFFDARQHHPRISIGLVFRFGEE